MTNRLLFIYKQREGYWGLEHLGDLSSGLRNSCEFVVKMLQDSGVEAKGIQVRDNNDIDREVKAYKPTHVIIEAFWVVPEKFDVLKPLHPNVKWIVRNHSEMPFLSNEGIALGWVAGYLQRGIEINSNSLRAYNEMKIIAKNYGIEDLSLITYLPNYYQLVELGFKKPSPFKTGTINIGCFGAIRPLKNQLAQAIAAIEFADMYDLQLNFYINGGRVEGNGAPILKNIKQLFENSKKHKLIEIPWMQHDAFISYISNMIDVSMQVSFSETFNIVTADAIAGKIPVVVSPEISWVGSYAHANPNHINSMIQALYKASHSGRFRAEIQIDDLKEYDKKSNHLWLERFAPEKLKKNFLLALLKRIFN